ncbi:MAG: dihydrolipoyl dehydrogenase [Dehalococcoidales bacterium]|nr:dihydrolipoyl dehydrogenase [Dehalococcoidales bacterium]
MKNYDAIIIGTGCGAIISEEASEHGLKTALIDKGPLIGGTCLNWGCIPSKQLIYPADRIVEIEESGRLGITVEVKNIDFNAIMRRVRYSRQESQTHLREGIGQVSNLDFYEGEARFVDDYILEVNGEKLKGDKIFIATGSRPFIPPVKGLENIEYLTNESALELRERPDSLIIIGGGYIAVEYGHFFAAMGTKVTILEMADRLILSEEPEIAELLKKKLSKRMAVHTGAQAEEVKASKNGVTVVIKDRKSDGEKRYTAQHIMMAVGRRSNADLLKVESTGVEVDARGFIKVNEHMETSQKNIFAVGDTNGQQMFTHMANREAAIVAHNVLQGAGMAVDYSAVPHAVYSHPQIASVGLREEDARKDHDIIIGRTSYYDVAKGEAMMETEGFAKAIVERETDSILGFHIIGPYAPELIQEVVNAMTSGCDVKELNEGIHIHPALSELIPTTVNSAGEG